MLLIVCRLIVHTQIPLLIMIITKKFGQRLKEIRLSKNISQEDLSFKSELHRTYISSVELGKRNISLINIEKLAKALDCQIIDFFITKNK